MNISRSARSFARDFAALTAAAVLTSVFAGPAAADEPTPTATAPATSEAPSTSEAPAGSEAPEPSTAPSSTQPENKPAAAQPQAEPAQRAQVAASIDLGDDPYPSNEDVHFKIKLTNTGGVTADGVYVYQLTDKPTDLNVPWGGWGDLSSGRGIKLEPDQSFELSGTGSIRDIRLDTVTVRAVLFDKTGFSVSPEFGASAKVTAAPGDASGIVYGDKNGNGSYDAGEKLTGIKLSLRYIHGDVTYTATSDENGTLTFNVPAADYYLGGDVVDGWLFPWRTVHIGKGTKLDLRGAPPLNGALKASMKFTQDSYKVGDTAHLTVTLANSGKTPLVGIVAECNRIGDPEILQGTGPGWGDLLWSRGVTIGAGETRTFDVTDTVPAAAFNRGFVVAACDFGYPEVDIENHAEASDQAAVPGGVGALAGEVEVYTDQGQVKHGVAGVKVVLTAEQACPVIGEQTTDEKGHFEFRKLVPGLAYKLYFLPPKGWKIKYDNPTSVDVYAPEDNPARLGIQAEEGDAPLPKVPTNPETCTAAASTTPSTGAASSTGGTGGGQSGGSGLASTGVDAIGLGALALLALALGGGLVVGARRRRRTI
ncbi:SdrD B-like domain-containing protein [Amycolatopsis sp. CA-126428]|uniref:SdrD B-like domain-containing protein n=1 Tax=Amycolatopsis sp. CA-126428 TaxID=2073158 RepID=UPI001E50F5FB|nr:SdrD B-like domain-containing protein [Amycolatopsis sp. CA-126428]